ncbi:hypothetical protein B4U80_12237, partial [Leptotrombidium deliense]
ILPKANLNDASTEVNINNFEFTKQHGSHLAHNNIDEAVEFEQAVMLQESPVNMQQNISLLMEIAQRLQKSSAHQSITSNIRHTRETNEVRNNNNSVNAIAIVEANASKDASVVGINGEELAITNLLTTYEATANECPICKESEIKEPCRPVNCANTEHHYCYNCLETWMRYNDNCPCCRTKGNKIIMIEDNKIRTIEQRSLLRYTTTSQNTPIQFTYEELLTHDPFYATNGNDDDVGDQQSDAFNSDIEESETDANDDTYFPYGVRKCGYCRENILRDHEKGVLFECFKKNNDHEFHFQCVVKRVAEFGCCT